MKEDIIELVNQGKKTSPHRVYGTNLDVEDYRRDILKGIDLLHGRSREGLWGVAAFILISIVALLCRDISILAPCPEPLREILGCTPPVYLIHAVLAISTCSALILIAGRMDSNAEPGSIWSQLFYRSVFYLVYFLSEGLPEGFVPAFLAGMAVMSMEYYHNWRCCRKAIKEEREALRKLALWPILAGNRDK
jgi:hypothetical protein